MKTSDSLDHSAARRTPATSSSTAERQRRAGPAPGVIQPAAATSLEDNPRAAAQRRRLHATFGAPVQREAAPAEDELQMKARPGVLQAQGLEEEEPLQGRGLPVQRQGAEEDELQMKAAPGAPAQRSAEPGVRASDTGLPDGLKTGIESLSGLSMDHVRVHYNSSQPAQLNALAYAQGSDIHLGPGQEQHLPHEAWHVVQQAQGRVRPTMQMREGVPVNDDAGLEREADVMGERALQRRPDGQAAPVATSGRSSAVIQALAIDDQPHPNLMSRAGLTLTKSGAGQTGVYFAQEAGERIVLKFLPSHEAFKVKAADTFVSEGTDLRTAGSRILTPASPANVAVRAAVRAHQGLMPPQVNQRLKDDVVADTSGAGTAVLLMEHVEQVSLQELAVGRPGHQQDDEHARLMAKLSNAAVARGFAQLLVIDALLGNADRFIKDAAPAQRVVDMPANISNIFVSLAGSSVVALDNAIERAAFVDDADTAMGQNRTYLVRYLAAPNIAAQVAQVVVKACLIEAGELLPANFPGNAYLALNTPLAGAMHMWHVEQAFAANLAGALATEIPNVLARLRANRKSLRKGYLDAAADAGVANPQQQADYDQLRARAKMLGKLREVGNEAEAQEAASEHLTHKRDKATRARRREEAAEAVAGAARGVAGFFTRPFMK